MMKEGMCLVRCSDFTAGLIWIARVCGLDRVKRAGTRVVAAEVLDGDETAEEGNRSRELRTIEENSDTSKGFEKTNSLLFLVVP